MERENAELRRVTVSDVLKATASACVVSEIEQIPEARGISELAAAYGSPRVRLELRRHDVRACSGTG